ncbi:MAG: helix-hairpin-helix domain-containing protein [Clostridia bacterium]|nr:helix-hairpin-helix domain-containing protein [Clostridia bacterium]
MLENKEKIIIVIIGVILIISVVIYFIDRNEENEFIEVNNEIANLTEEEVVEETEESEEIILHIIGAVKNPGIVKIKEGSRIVAVIEAAGGIAEDADISKINLAYVVEDGQKIFIPSITDEITEETEYVTSESGDNIIVDDNEGENVMVNINKATQTELETLPGIGPAMALRIIEHREENGNFENIEEIKNVKGIGDAKFENIKNNICVK